MGRLRTSVAFDIGPLLVADEALGGEVELLRDSYRVVIRLPPKPSSERGYDLPWFDGSRQQDGSVVKHGVRRILVSVYWADAPDPSADRDTYLHAASQFIRKGREIAQRVARVFVDWTRIQKGQTWLPEHLQDLPFEASGGAVDDETGEALPLVVGLAIHIHQRPAGTEVDRVYLEAVRERLAHDQDIPLPERFLADALYFATRFRPADIQRAVLLAAIAAELKVKEVLRREAGAKLPLVQIILEHPRDVSVAAIDLFHKTMKATVGRALHDEDPTLHRAIQRLFELRNAIVHAGETPAPDVGRAAVLAARGAFDWLGTVKAEVGEHADDSG